MVPMVEADEVSCVASPFTSGLCCELGDSGGNGEGLSEGDGLGDEDKEGSGEREGKGTGEGIGLIIIGVGVCSTLGGGAGIVPP